MLFICEENSDPNQYPQPVDATVVVQLTVPVAVAVGNGATVLNQMPQSGVLMGC